MESIIIAVTGTVTAIGVLYKAYVELQKKGLDSKGLDRRNDIDEFGTLLQGYKDLKNEYEEQVKELRAENILLKKELNELRSIMKKYEAKLREFEIRQQLTKKEKQE